MKVRFFSRDVLIHTVKNSPDMGGVSVISISDSSKYKREMRGILKNRVGNFRCYVFADVYDNSSGFTTEKARSIKEFVDNCQKANVEEIWVHCLMGISRSAAVVKWINNYLGLNDNFVERWPHSNHHIYEVLCEVSGVITLRQHYEKLEEI